MYRCVKCGKKGDMDADLGVICMGCGETEIDCTCKKPICSSCNDAARTSLAQEIRNGLRLRGFWTGETTSDLITAIFKALDSAK